MEMINTVGHRPLGEFTDAVCTLFGPYAVPGKLERENRWGIQIKINKKYPEIIQFRFVTLENHDVYVSVDIHEVKKKGAGYFDVLMLEFGRKEHEYDEQRQKQEAIHILSKSYLGLDEKPKAKVLQLPMRNP